MTSAARSRRTSSARSRSAATRACGTAGRCRSAASARTRTRAPARAAQGDRRQEEGDQEVDSEDGTAWRSRRPARPSAASGRTSVHGQAHIKSTFNNTIVTITDLQGNTLSWASAGNVGFKGSRKSTPFAAQLAAGEGRPGRPGARPAEGRRVREGPGLGARDGDPLARRRGLEVTVIQDVTPVPHNGCRPASVAASSAARIKAPRAARPAGARAASRGGVGVDDPPPKEGTTACSSSRGLRSLRTSSRRPAPEVRHRAAGARVRLHRGQLAPPHAAVVDPRRRDLVGPHRRGAARVLDGPQGDRGRHRHHPEPEGARRPLRPRRADHGLPEGEGPGRGHRR